MFAKRTSLTLFAAAMLGASFVPTMAAAKDAGDFVARVRGLAFLTDTDGTTNTLGGSARTSDDYVPELDFSYFVTKNLAAELVLATTKHSVEIKNSTSGDLDLGTVRLIPPTLTLQWHFFPSRDLSPYIGAGATYVFIADHETGRSVNDVSYSSEFGYAFQVGVDFRLRSAWSINLDLKKIFVDTDIHANNGTIRADGTNLDPWVVGIGIGYTF